MEADEWYKKGMAEKKSDEKKSSEKKVPGAVGADFKFENALKRLAEVVRLLERNDCELGEALKLFEEGVSLTRACHSKLSDAEKKIELLTKVSADGVETIPLGD